MDWKAAEEIGHFAITPVALKGAVDLEF